MQPLRPDEVKGHVKKLDDGFGDVVVGTMVFVFAESDPSVVGEIYSGSHTVILPSIIESFTFWGLGDGQP